MSRSLSLIPLLAMVVLLAMACGGTDPAASSSKPVGPYPVLTQASPTPMTSAAAPYPVVQDGRALMSARCTVCHNTERIQAAKKNKTDWESTVARMKGKSATLSDTETRVLADFLSTTFK